VTRPCRKTHWWSVVEIGRVCLRVIGAIWQGEKRSRSRGLHRAFSTQPGVSRAGETPPLFLRRATRYSKGPNGGFGPFEEMRCGAVEEEKKTARAERSPLHIAKPET